VLCGASYFISHSFLSTMLRSTDLREFSSMDGKIRIFCRRNPSWKALKTAENSSDPCGGRYVYVHDFPARFNEDVMKECPGSALPWRIPRGFSQILGSIQIHGRLFSNTWLPPVVQIDEYPIQCDPLNLH
jgi:hypothetical protein